MPKNIKNINNILYLRALKTQEDIALALLYQLKVGAMVQLDLGKWVEYQVPLPPRLTAKAFCKNLTALSTRLLNRDIFSKKLMKRVSSEDWKVKYQKFLKPFPLVMDPNPGKRVLTVDPTETLPHSLKKDTLYLQAGLAFGTGTHPSTQLAATLLANTIPLIKGKRTSVLDMGCGTGILCMVAHWMQVRILWAVDHDPQALELAETNFKINRMPKINLMKSIKGVQKKFDVIVANITLDVLLILKDSFFKHLKKNGYLILSGLLYQDVSKLAQGYKGWRIIDRKNLKGWASILLQRS